MASAATAFTAIKLLLFVSIAHLVICDKTYQDEDAKNKLEQYIQEHKSNVNPRYRLLYHIAAPVGWINDPNGFSFFRDQYHLFYQFYPYDSVWGTMHWGHVVSDNLVDWQYRPTALLPGEEQCFSGSAVEDDSKLTLIYTAHRDLDGRVNESQYLAFSEDGINFDKFAGNPVLPATPDGASDFRDPKVWRHGDYWYVILGSKTVDNRGRVLLYRSVDLHQWDFINVLSESHGNLGYMWECPDFFELDGSHILLMSPQGMQPEGDRYLNTFQNGYIAGQFDYETHEFRPTGSFVELDYGHDFYAATTVDVSGRRLVVAWFGMWEVPHPEAEDGWAGAMTIVRELHATSEGLITMQPVQEIDILRSEPKEFDFYTGGVLNDIGSTLELIVFSDGLSINQLLLEGSDGGQWVRITWNPSLGKMIVDRSGDIRQVEWKFTGDLRWRIFLDTSSMELFCGQGEVVFSSRLYPLGEWRIVNEGASLWINSYKLRRSVPV